MGLHRRRKKHPVLHCTGQQQKYTLSENSHTLFILGRWLQIQHSFFLSRQNFVVLLDYRFLDRLLAFWFFFNTFKKSIFSFLSENKIELSVICKKIPKIGQTVAGSQFPTLPMISSLLRMTAGLQCDVTMRWKFKN